MGCHWIEGPSWPVWLNAKEGFRQGAARLRLDEIVWCWSPVYSPPTPQLTESGASRRLTAPARVVPALPGLVTRPIQKPIAMVANALRKVLLQLGTLGITSPRDWAYFKVLDS